MLNARIVWRSLFAIPAAAVLVLTGAVAATASTGGIGCSEPGETVECSVGGGDNGSGGSGTGPVTPGGNVDIPFIPGPTQCLTANGEELPCVDPVAGGQWSNDRHCYVTLAPLVDRDPPAGASPNGAWYFCQGYGSMQADIFWSDTPPAGITTYSPQQAAAILISRFELYGIDIGIAPDPGAGQEAVIGVPVWLWVENPTEQTWGPYTLSDTLGGVNVSATATAQHVTWSLGDGTTVQCGQGTPYSSSQGMRPSPTCGHTFQTVPDGGSFEISARTIWQINWQAAGVTGSTQIETTSAPTALPVIQFQSVNVPNP